MTDERMSSWVLRSGACSESICCSHALCASCSAGNTSCSGSSNGKLQSCVGAHASGCRPELDDRDVVARRVEHRLERPCRSRGRRTRSRRRWSSSAGPSSRSTTAATYGHPSERRQVVAVHDGPRVERRRAARLVPLDVVAPALRAERARVEVVLAARVAVLDEERPSLVAVPERLRSRGRAWAGRTARQATRYRAGSGATATPVSFASPSWFDEHSR